MGFSVIKGLISHSEKKVIYIPSLRRRHLDIITVTIDYYVLSLNYVRMNALDTLLDKITDLYDNQSTLYSSFHDNDTTSPSTS